MRKQSQPQAETPKWYAREWLKAKGVKQSDIVAASGRTKGEVSEWVNGGRRINDDVLEIFAKVLGITKGDLYRKPGARALLIGKVGAGAEVTRFDEGVVLQDLELPPGHEGCNVAEIVGDSQYPLQDGWLVSYGPEHQGVPEDIVGKLAVVQIKEGATLLKTVKRGRRKGFFRLESWNAPAMEDVKLVWAAKVLTILIR